MTEAVDPFAWCGSVLAGKYRIDAVVGEGGFGVVYRAFHLGFNEPVAVKCLKMPPNLRGEERARFEGSFAEEGRLLHKLSRATAGIVQALDVGAAQSPNGAWTPYIVLEWLHGKTLETHIEERAHAGAAAHSVEDAIGLLDPAARAIDLAHREGIAHRDIKPANLFLTSIAGKQSLKVLDFGIAKVMTDSPSLTKAFADTGQSLRAFSASYGAPEQFNPALGATGPWTDVFALALIFVELLAGERALFGSDTMSLYVQASDERQRPTPRGRGVHVTDAVETVLATALAVNTRARYRSVGQFWDALQGAAAPAGVGVPRTVFEAPAMSGDRHVPPATPRVGPTEVTPSPARPHGPPSSRWMVFAGLAAFAGFVVLALFLLTANTPSAPSGAASKASAGLDAGTPVGTVPSSPAASPRRTHAQDPAPSSQGPVGMLYVPGGTFTMGNPAGGRTERPAHPVTLTKAFFIDRTEATVESYARCVLAGKCTSTSIHDDARVVPDQEQIEKFGSMCNELYAERASHPINCVDRSQARVFCAYVGKRLPTEAEWEFAARGSDARAYPWGNDKPGCDRAVVSGCSKTTPALAGTKSVGSFPAGKSAFGAFDMAGNVWEWVEDSWDPDAYVRPSASPDPLALGESRFGILRGGSWDFSAAQLVSTFRLKYPKGSGHVSTGFRCVKTAE